MWIGEEVWKPIPGFEGYEVSKSGLVRSWHNSGGKPGGKHKKRRIPRKLKPWADKQGYLCVSLRSVCGGKKNLFVARLVLLTFVGSPRPKKEVAHINGVRTDNRLLNLIWATPKENNSHKKKHGTHLVGEHCNGAKLTGSIVSYIKRVLTETGTSLVAKLARTYNVSPFTIYDINSGRTWNHI